MNPEQINAFLEELTALTHRYDIAIGGCGCCGSPYLEPRARPYEVAGEKDREGWIYVVRDAEMGHPTHLELEPPEIEHGLAY